MLDIIPKIVSEINNSSIAFESVHSPDFYVKDWWEIVLPSIAIAERGGSESWYYRILFSVRAKTIWASRQLAIQVIDLMENMLDPELKRQKVNWWLDDKLVNWKWETIFYMLFYEADSD